MKTIITRLSLSAVLMMCCMAMNAQVEFTVDGIKYKVPDENENTVEVVKNDPKYSGSVVIPSTVTYDSKTYNVTGIGHSAFFNCSGLTSVTIPEGVTYIRDHAFFGCEGLEGDLVIPSTVKSIGERAFYNFSVSSVKVFALVPPELGNNAFGDYAIPLYVPDVEKYKECDGWKDYSNIQPLNSFRLGDQTYSLNEAGGFLAQDLTFNDKGTYVSGLDFTANKLTYSRTFKDTNWQALYVPFAMSYDDWRDKFDVAAINNFHEYTDGDGNTVKTELEVRLVKSGTLKPNHPYLIRAKDAAPYSQSIELSTKKICKSDENSIDCSSVERKYTFTGTYRGIAGLKTNGYIFMSGGKLSKAGNDTDVLSAQRWYLHIESRGSQIDNGGYSNTPMQFDIRLLDDDATGIDEITVTRTPLKDSSNALYNLNGMRVNDSYKGIVIRNGKKFYQR